MTEEQPPIPPEGSEQDTPIWKRWWFWAAIVVVVGIVTSMGGTEDDVTPLATETTTTESGATTTSTDPTTSTSTTSVPSTTTTTIPAWESFTVEGSGDDFFEFSIPNDDAAVLAITHQGSSNFAVISYTAGNERLDLLVNEIGAYDGRVPVNFLIGEEVGLLEITASGPWTVTAIPPGDLTFHFDEASGRGDDVVVMEVSSPMLRATHDGQSNFVVIAWSDGRDLLVNEIGAYDATVRTPTGAVIYEINADGNWTLTSGS